VIEDCLKISAYFGERDTVRGGALLADHMLDLFEEHALQTSILLRGTEGFGEKHRLQTQRFLSLSEDLPMIGIGVDARDRVASLVERLRDSFSSGLFTVERARMLTGRVGAVELPDALGEETKLTIYCGRAERVLGRPAITAIVDLLRRHGLDGATVLLGVDGVVHGLRQRGRFFSRNANVPVMIVAVGSSATIAQALPKLGSALDRPLLTLERVTVLKRDGRRLAPLGEHPDDDARRARTWQKLMIYAGEQARWEGHPLYVQLIRGLRRENAAGATAIRGVWGYHGEHAPHGDRLLSLRRHVPVVTVVVDRPSEIRRLWPLVDAATAETGLVTSELVYERS
jgi:PII-like signaling protein